MPSLSSSIVNQQVASVREVEEALSRQSLYGGDLITNLLELAAVSEERLGTVLAECHELEPAPPGELPVSPEHVRRLVPGDLAQRFAFYPLEEREGTVTVAVAEPLPAEIEQDLSFSLGARIMQRVALLVRVRQAIARDYGSILDRRSLRVLARLSGKRDPSPSSIPSPPSGPSAFRFALGSTSERPSLAEIATAAAGVAATSAKPEPPKPEPVASVRPRVTRVPAPPALPVAPDLSSLARPTTTRPRRLGPFTIAMAERSLLEARTRDDVLRAFFDFASQYFDYSALFAVHGDLAEGRDASGAGAPRSRIVAVGVPLDLPSAMSRARESAVYELARLTSGGLDGALAKDLERRPGRLVLFLPVHVRGRTVLILYGDHGDQDVELSAVGDVISFAPLVANAFERLILRKRLRDKGADAPDAGVRPNRVREAPAPQPNIAEHASTLASLIEDATLHSSRPPQRASLAPAVRRSPLPPEPGRETRTPPTPRYTPAPTVAIPVVSIGPAAVRNGRNEHASSSAPKARISEPPEEGWDSAPATGRFARNERGTKPGVGGPSAQTPTQHARPTDLAASARDLATPPEAALAEPARAVENALVDPAEAVESAPPRKSRPGSLPRLQLVPDTVPPPSAPSEGPELEVFEDPDDSEHAPHSFDDEDAESPAISSGVPLAPASRSVAYSARPLPMRDLSQDVGLPSVIVDLASDTQALVERLLDGDASATEKLVRIGDTAITVLASIFPGPITAELRRSSGDGPGKASECGPVLRTLARMGTRPVPFVAVRTADGDPVVRAWATRLLGEMPSAESAQAVARRLTDDDADVQRAALAAGHMLLHSLEAGEALQAKVAETVSDATRPEEVRHTLIEALAELRAPLVVPTLLRLLEDGSPDIVRSAHWALGVITRQDFGTKAALWEQWWLANSGRHRIEWLIDSLMHEDQDLRRLAGDELKSLTKEYFGYYDDLPKKERERAQDRYRKWWESKGKARFRW